MIQSSKHRNEYRNNTSSDKDLSSTRRCAIYTRKSSDQGLDLAVNSLDTQRGLCESFITAQENWFTLPTQYNDGGFTGGNTDRPALHQLMNDIEAGRIDCVVVYKIDRLSRSLMDFAQLMHRFEQNNVTFVSITQQFNTTTAMGKLMLAILTSFSAYERELISERTRDKIADTRRKGFWTGGRPILGYDIERLPTGPRLAINEDEAKRVTEIFKLYLQEQSLIKTVNIINKRQWMTKQWVTRKGKINGGREFNKNTLHAMLSNPIYCGKIRYKDEIHSGVHDAIIPEDLWNQVQVALKRLGQMGRPPKNPQHYGILSGLLRCGHCQSALIHTYTQKRNKQYRYYKCLKVQKQGSGACPSSAIAAGKLESYLIEQINHVGHQQDLQNQVISRLVDTPENNDAEESTRNHLHQQWQEAQKEWIKITQRSTLTEKDTEHLAEIENQMQSIEGELSSLNQQMTVKKQRFSTQDIERVREALKKFEVIWASLTLTERNTLLKSIFHQITITKVGDEHQIQMSFHQEILPLLNLECHTNEPKDAAKA